jgi:hypothetical protein
VGRRLDQLGSATRDQLLANPLRTTFAGRDVSASQDASISASVTLHSRKPVYARISLRWRCAVRLANSNDASSPAGTRTWRARCATASSGSARETTAPEQELQQRREPQSRRAGLVAQQIQLVADQGEVIDDLIQTQVARHLSGSPGRSGRRACS